MAVRVPVGAFKTSPCPCVSAKRPTGTSRCVVVVSSACRCCVVVVTPRCRFLLSPSFEGVETHIGSGETRTGFVETQIKVFETHFGGVACDKLWLTGRLRGASFSEKAR